MSILKNLISLSLSATIFTGSLNAYGSAELCKEAFLATSPTSEQITKSITVREHFKKLGVLKPDTEITRLSAEDKNLYLSMLDLDYAKAQEIMRLFATFPILTSSGVRGLFSLSRGSLKKSLKDFLADTRSSERIKISAYIASKIIQELGASNYNDHQFILTEDFEDLDSTRKVEAYRKQKELVISFGIPGTMVREIAQFFDPINVPSNEAAFIQALIYKNFDTIAVAAEPLSTKIYKAVTTTQLVSVPITQAGGSLLALQLFGVDLGADSGATAFIATMAAMLGSGISAFMFSVVPVPLQEKVTWTNWLNKAKTKITLKKREKQIRQDMLILSGLDPKSIQALPSVQKLKKNLDSPQSLKLLPAMLDHNVLAYPEVNLVQLENSFESKISIEEINTIVPNFSDFEELTTNPFALNSFGKELNTPQFLIIGREEILAARFSEINQRLTLWQDKRIKAKTETEKAWITDEKIKLLNALHHYSDDNSTSFKYLNALKKATIRFQNYLDKQIAPHEMRASVKSQLEVLEESFNTSLALLNDTEMSLEQRATAVSKLIESLKN